MVKNNIRGLIFLSITLSFYTKGAKNDILYKQKDSYSSDNLYSKYLTEEKNKIILKRANFQKIMKSLPEYKNADNQYKLYIEEQQKELADKANKMQKESEELETQWSEKKKEMLQIQDRSEYEAEYAEEEKIYMEKKKIFEEKYRLLMGEQNTMEADARNKHKELFNPVEKKAVKFIDEFVKNLEKAISDFKLKNNKKAVKIICLNSSETVNSEAHMKTIDNLDITEDILKFIQSKNIAVNMNEDPDDNLKNKKKTNR